MEKDFVATNLESDVFLLGYLGDFFKYVLKSLLSSVRDVVHHLRTELGYTIPPTWSRKTTTVL